MHTLSNKYITAKISDHGAELHSLLHNGFEYIWQASPKYWSRHAPILFPIVGKVFNNEYRVEGKTYTLPQHGFARDSEFQLITSSDTEATFRLHSTNETLKLYPYRFELYVKYILSDNSLTVTYTVQNRDDKDIYFQIGGHPAFNWQMNTGYLQFNKNGKRLTEIYVKRPNVSGYISEDIEQISLSNGLLSIQNHSFDKGALILEDNQCDCVSILDENQKPHLTLTSDAKLFGIWSPEHKNAPFVCIEPWLGRADDNCFSGEFKNKPFINCLETDKYMTLEFTIAL